ncbi:MAG: cyclic nucleotide-binding domain-containing protein [Gammaproteobacteria bacterium]|nr:cyclic nucleotide-binding domain-containing protein [Gammaproteobacteria bacterium]
MQDAFLKFKYFINNLSWKVGSAFNRKRLASIEKLLQHTHLFDHLDHTNLKKLVRLMRPLRFPKDTLLIKEGEIGHSCYILMQGSLRVFTHRNEGEEIDLAQLEEGQYVGEQALINETGERQASVQALTDVIVLEVSRQLFSQFLDNKTLAHLKKIGKDQFFARMSAQHHIYQSIEKLFRNDTTLQPRYFKNGAVIFKQGEVSDAVYFIQLGTVEISIKSPGQTSQVIQLNAGHLFGELGVITKTRRAGTAKAMGSVEVLKMPAERFEEIYADSQAIRELTQAQISVYPLRSHGIMMQYLGQVGGMEAICAIFKLQDGSVATASRAINHDIFAISKSDLPKSVLNQTQTLSYEGDNRVSRKITFYQGRCLNCFSEGSWEELGKVCRRLLDGTAFNEEEINHFTASGLFWPPSPLPEGNNQEIICECMQVTRGELKQAIQSGLTNFNALSDKTAAGTVCGSCQPKILKLLNLNNAK